ncbi:MAG TPA: YceI family protein [Chitinophagaceae bacterium]|nr:YceI family protein [Chitinophagaceae bacterium]
MKHSLKKVFLLAALLFALLPCNASCQATWHPVTYNISFKIKNAGIAVSGKFSDLKTELVFSPDKLATSKLSGSVVPATLKTGINMRDNHIKEESYLDAEKFKLIEITSLKLYPQGTGYAGLFRITIKGVSKEMEIPFDFIQFGDQADFNASFTINRRDFNVGGSSMTMADNVAVSIKIKARN